MSDFEFPARVTSEEVIRALTYMTHEDLIGFLEELDDTIGDWDFTRLAYGYFKEQIDYLDRDKGGGWH